jgi:hypothetical protein
MAARSVLFTARHLCRARHTILQRAIGDMERDRKNGVGTSTRTRVGAEEAPRPRTPDERVLQASFESFPASDPPGWIAGSATPCETPE